MREITDNLQPRWMTREQAAEYLGCSVRQLEKLESEGVLKASRALGPRSPRLDRQQLDRWMAGDANTETPPETSVRLAAL